MLSWDETEVQEVHVRRLGSPLSSASSNTSGVSTFHNARRFETRRLEIEGIYVSGPVGKLRSRYSHTTHGVAGYERVFDVENMICPPQEHESYFVMGTENLSFSVKDEISILFCSF